MPSHERCMATDLGDGRNHVAITVRARELDDGGFHLTDFNRIIFDHRICQQLLAHGLNNLLSILF